MAENPKAISYLTKALALEPNYGLAAALGAWAHGQQVAYNWTSDIAAERAEASLIGAGSSGNVDRNVKE